jgi:dTDP-4-amino-4,6-dideoxygalactose transaminase
MVKSLLDDKLCVESKPIPPPSKTMPFLGDRPVRQKMLPFSPPDIGEEEIAEVVDTLRSGWITTGPKAARFEEDFRRYVGSRHAIALSSATAGLHLALIAAGVGPGDEVITTPYTFAATASVVIHCGARPVFADVEENTGNIDPEAIEPKITHRTKAIIPVHLGGLPCRMDEIRAIAKQHRLVVIEDAAHAVGASYKGRMVGSIGDMTVFSFHAVKNLTTAEGGMLTTDNDKWARLVRLWGLHGQTKTALEKFHEGSWFYEIAVPGYKYNMTDIQAAIGIHQLARLEKMISIRERYAAIYDEGLGNLHQIVLPKPTGPVRHAWHLYMIRLLPDALSITRDGFIEALKEENISSNVHYIPVHLHPYYRKTYGYKEGDFPVAEGIYRHEVTLPLYSKMTEDDVKDVVKGVRKIVNFYSKG